MDLVPSIAGFDENSYYVIQNRAPLAVGVLVPILLTKERIYLRTFDRDLTPQKSVEIKLGKGKDVEATKLLLMNPDKQLFLFSTLNQGKYKKCQLIVREVSRTDLSYPEKGRVLMEFSYDGFNNYRYNPFSFVRSRDSSKIAFIYTLPGEKDEPVRFAVHTFSQDMTPLWNQEFELPYDRNMFGINRIRIDNEARVYLLASKKLEKEDREKGLSKYEHKILTLLPGQEQAMEQELALAGKFITDVHLEVFSNQELACAGIYAQKDRENRTMGVFYQRMNAATGEVISYSEEELSLAMLSGEEEDKSKQTRLQAKVEQNRLAKYNFDEIVLRSDGGVLLIGEIHYTTTRQSTSSTTNATTTTTYYHRKDIVTLNISPDGIIEEVVGIPKSQVTTATALLYLSYAVAVNEDKLHFIFNDNIDNLTLKEGERPKSYSPSAFSRKKQVVEVVTVGADGELVREALVSFREADQSAIPLASIQTSPREMILFFQKGKD